MFTVPQYKYVVPRLVAFPAKVSIIRYFNMRPSVPICSETDICSGKYVLKRLHGEQSICQLSVDCCTGAGLMSSQLMCSQPMFSHER